MVDATEAQKLAPDVPVQFLPSKFQLGVWKRWVAWGDGADPAGNFNGWCAIHHPDVPSADTPPDATYSFQSGIMRCNSDKDCHPGKRCISLTNVAIARLSTGGDVE